jgi:pimeloyl-ACP methyl ester carboxylesterase
MVSVSVKPEPIAVRTYPGDGPPVAVLHGGPGAPWTVAALAADLAPTFRVLEPLQRRSGGVPLTVAGHVADLAAVVPEPMRIVGWSWGAMLALSFTVAHPELVTSLALVGCGTYDVAARESYDQMMRARLSSEDRAALKALTGRVEKARDPDERARLLKRRGELWNRVLSVDLVQHQRSDFPEDPRGREETWNDVLRLQEAGIEPEAFRAIRVPVAMVHGDDDPHPGEATYETLRRHIPQLAYVHFGKCGHIPWLERHARTRFLDALRTWLTESTA